MEQNSATTTPVMDGGKPSNTNGLKIATAIASIVAVCGIGFGIYGMVQSSQKDTQISDLKVQIKDDTGTITTIETPTIETTTEEGTTITITDSAIVRTNPVVISSDVEDSDNGNYNNVYSLIINSKLLSNGDMSKSWRVSSSDGNLTCQIMEDYVVIDDCDISAHSGKVSNIYSAGPGNGIEDYILILTESGEIEYLSDVGEDYNVLKKLNLPKKVAQVYPNVTSTSVDESGRFLSSGRDALIVYFDGQIADFYDVIYKYPDLIFQ